VADPSRERGTPARAPAGRVAVGLRAARPPRPANDNGILWLKRLWHAVPIAAAVALLLWALIHAFGIV